MRQAVFAVAVVFATCGPTLSQNLDALTDALSHAPETVLAQPTRVQFSFLDIWALHAIAERAGTPLGAESLLRSQAGWALRPIEALHRGGVDAWEAKSGLPLDELSFVAGFGSTPNGVSIWGLADEAAANGLLQTLGGHGFAPVGDKGVLGNGEPMIPDLRNRDPSNPWGSGVGAASFVVADGNAVVQASRPETLPIMTAGQRSMADNPVIAAALQGLEQVAGDGWIVQAMVISPAFGIGSFDPASVLASNIASLDEMRERLQAGLEDSAKGIPFYLGGLIADVEGDGPGVAMALVYPDCATAEAAADDIGERWTQTMPAAAQGEMTITTGDGVAGFCTALVTVFGADKTETGNPMFNALFDMEMRRQFIVLQIGEGH